jgi:hypothetical protein|tara:strand:- start:362 stop:484 length:123 start_codon:yes stop_codon:yes gene_type:complete
MSVYQNEQLLETIFEMFLEAGYSEKEAQKQALQTFENSNL